MSAQQNEHRSIEAEHAALRLAILRACSPPAETDTIRQRVERTTGLRVSNGSIGNMAGTLHRAGLLRYRSADGLSYGDWHWLTNEGRSVIRYFGALA
jgi:hypothetical protein